jgi:hypothetical protein
MTARNNAETAITRNRTKAVRNPAEEMAGRSIAGSMGIIVSAVASGIL